jgi:predicted transcriptional regulator
VKKKMKLDLSENGFYMIHPKWQIEALKVVWEAGEGLVSKQVWERVNNRLNPTTVSRASIINFLNFMLELNVLSGIDETSKGGHRTRYSPALGENRYKEFIVESTLSALKDSFPTELEKVLNKN